MDLYIFLISPRSEHGTQFLLAASDKQLSKFETIVQNRKIGFEIMEHNLKHDITLKICSFYGDQSTRFLSLYIDKLSKTETNSIGAIIGLVTNGQIKSIDDPDNRNMIYDRFASPDSSDSVPRRANFTIRRMWDMKSLQREHPHLNYSVGVIPQHRIDDHNLQEVRYLLGQNEHLEVPITYCDIKNRKSIKDFLENCVQYIKDKNIQDILSNFVSEL